MSVKLMLHSDQTLQGQFVNLCGGAWLRCKFINCTCYIRETNFSLRDCDFTNCIYHLDVMLISKQHADILIDFLYDSRRSMAPDDPPQDEDEP